MLADRTVDIRNESTASIDGIFTIMSGRDLWLVCEKKKKD